MRLDSSGFLALSTEILARGHQLRFKARGSSMLPSIRSGQVIQVEPARAEDLRLGDVIFYHTLGGALIAHRLVKKSEGPGGLRLVTRGDACPWDAAEQIAPEQVLGRVVSIDFGKGRKLRIDAGWGRLLGIWLARASLLISWTYPLLRRLRGSFSRLLQQLGEKAWL